MKKKKKTFQGRISQGLIIWDQFITLLYHRSSKKDSYITLFWLPILLSKYTGTLFADIVEGVCFYLEHLLIQVNMY